MGLPRRRSSSEAANVEGCVFIHAAGFIGGANSKEGVLKLAALAV
ncbi:MYG1 family protein [Spongiibacter tropicus]